MANRDYKSAIDALNGLQTNHQVLDQIRKSGKPDKSGRRSIDEDRIYVQRIGYQLEDLNALNVIHITGTKGKGSTSAFCDSLLRRIRPDFKVGMYTSPHLVAVRERIMINGRPLSEEKFAQYFWEVWDRLEESEKKSQEVDDIKPKPMYFRYLTLLMWHVFLSEKVDASIVEVGIGGTFDSTNIVPKPRVTGITSLGIDHITVLGRTIPEIADQKAGIYKFGVPAFTVEQPPEGFKVIQKKAIEANALSLNVIPIIPELRHLVLGLAGAHQLSNASLAVAMVLTFVQDNLLNQVISSTTPPHLPSSIIAPQPLPSLVVNALEEVRWPGRCQTVEKNNIRWLLDGAHTVESLRVCAEWWTTVVRPHPHRKRVLIFNCTSGRSGESLLESFLTTAIGILSKNESVGNLFEEVIFCTNVTYSDGGFKGDLTANNVSPESLQSMTIQQEIADGWLKLAQRDDLQSFELRKARVTVLPSIEDAVKRVETKGPIDVLVTGSLHLIGGVMDVAKLL